MILGFLYTFALIAYAGGEVDAIEFSTYENIWTLINALQTVAYAVLISVMFSTFIIKEYAGKLNLLLFTYPVDKSTLLKAKVLLVAFSGIGGMLLGSALIFLIFFITERIFPLVPDTFSFGNIIKIWTDTRALLRNLRIHRAHAVGLASQLLLHARDIFLVVRDARLQHRQMCIRDRSSTTARSSLRIAAPPFTA